MALQPCINCEANISEKAIVCPKCGEKKPFQKWRCSDCGFLLTKNTTTCPECGNPEPYEQKRQDDSVATHQPPSFLKDIYNSRKEDESITTYKNQEYLRDIYNISNYQEVRKQENFLTSSQSTSILKDIYNIKNYSDDNKLKQLSPYILGPPLVIILHKVLLYIELSFPTSSKFFNNVLIIMAMVIGNLIMQIIALLFVAEKWYDSWSYFINFIIFGILLATTKDLYLWYDNKGFDFGWFFLFRVIGNLIIGSVAMNIICEIRGKL